MIGALIRTLLGLLKIKSSIYKLIAVSVGINLIIYFTKKHSIIHFIISTLVSTLILCYLYGKYETKSKTKRWYIYSFL